MTREVVLLALLWAWCHATCAEEPAWSAWNSPAATRSASGVKGSDLPDQPPPVSPRPDGSRVIREAHVPIGQRRLLQESTGRKSTADFACFLSDGQRDAYLKADTRTWILDDASLNDLGNDLQAVVDCTQRGDRIFFNTTQPIRPAARTVVPWDLVFSTALENFEMEHELSHEMPTRTVFTCPKEGEGVFLLRARTVLIENLEFQLCSWEAESKSAAIIEVDDCSSETDKSHLRLSNVVFKDNTLVGASGVHFKASSCAETEWNAVHFVENSCSGTCGALLPAASKLSDVRFFRNEEAGSVEAPPVMLKAPSGSRSSVDRISALENDRTIFLVEDGALTLTHGNFTHNSGSVSKGVNTSGACIHLINSSASFEDLFFLENRAEHGTAVFAEQSGLDVLNSTFIGNYALRGGAMYIQQRSTVSIDNCTFSFNSASFDAGVAHVTDSAVQIRESTFIKNSAAFHGGCLSAVDGSRVKISHSSALKNIAENGGVASFRAGSIGTVQECQFEGNEARTNGGTLSVFESTLKVSSCQFLGGSADFGGLIASPLASNVSVIDSELLEAVASYGGCILGAKDTNLTVHNATFEANRAGGNGAGILLQEKCTGRISKSKFRSNEAAGDGGGIYADASTVLVETSSFVENRGTDGGGLKCINGTTCAAADCEFVRNRAAFGGATYASVRSSVNISRSIFKRNTASKSGGHISIELSKLQLSDCRLERGFAQFGGLLFGSNSEIDIQSSRMANASATSGGCFYIRDKCEMRVDKATVADCEADHDGGAAMIVNSALTVRDSILKNNFASGDGGGLYAMEGGLLDLHNSSFTDSVAENGAAVLLRSSVDAVATNCEFAENIAQRSGADIFAETSSLQFVDCNFRQSTAEFGGSICAHSSRQLKIENSTFNGSWVNEGGGCLAVEKTRVLVQNTVFENCYAVRHGGAVYLLDRSTIIASHSTFRLNRAINEGGAIYAIRSSLTGDDLLFQRNNATMNGGAVYFRNAGVISFARTRFVENAALLGGAIWMLSVQNGSMVETVFDKNSAMKEGGAVYMHDSKIKFRSGIMTANSARDGGALLVNNSTIVIEETSFHNGSATHCGGFLLAKGRSSIVVNKTVMINGSASLGGGISLKRSSIVAERLQVSECRAREGGGVHGYQFATMLCTNCIFRANRAEERGGGVSFDFRLAMSLALQLHDTLFRNNTAKNGGGLHVITNEEKSNCSRTGARCTIVALTEVKFVGNAAAQAGGAILVSDPSTLRFACSSAASKEHERSFYTKQQWNSLEVLNSLEAVCSSWKDNTAGAYGDSVASYARQVVKLIRCAGGHETRIVTEDEHVIPSHKSGTLLPVITLLVQDAFGQGPAISVNNGTIEATMISPDDFFTGSVKIALTGGKGKFNGVAGFQAPGKYRICIKFNDNALRTFHISVQVRRCKIGETTAANGMFCQPCNGASFNFFPDENTGCLACPSDGNCDTNVIRPNKAHWHRSPCSTRIQSCLSRRACDFPERSQRLMQLGKDLVSCEFSDAFLEQYSDAQCRKGHGGPLCGSCKPSYGRLQSFECGKCLGVFASSLLVLLSIWMLLGLSGFTVRSNRIPNSHRLRKCTSDASKITECPSARSVVVNEKMVEMMITGYVPPEARTACQPIGGVNDQADQNLKKEYIFAELSKWKAAELFKITINNLQVTAVALSVNVVWQRTVISFFEVTDFLSGVTSEAAARSVDCLIPNDLVMSRSVVSALINLSVPLVVIVFFVAFWISALCWYKESAIYLLKKSVLSAVAVSYISYISITKTLVNVLNCVEVYDFGPSSMEITTYRWARDTSLECFAGSHALLAGLVALPLLSIFTLGFPIAAALIIVKKVGADYKDGWIYETAGFLYRAYKPRYVFWESIIMLRKALLAVVVVFAYPLSSNLQGVLAVFVLTVALYFHMVCRPYREEFDILNEMEAVSLLVSLITFVSSLFFNDDRVSSFLRLCVTSIVFSCNIGLVVFFVGFFLLLGFRYLKAVLDREELKYDPTGNSVHILRVYVRSYLFHVVRDSVLDVFTCCDCKEVQVQNET